MDSERPCTSAWTLRRLFRARASEAAGRKGRTQLREVFFTLRRNSRRDEDGGNEKIGRAAAGRERRAGRCRRLTALVYGSAMSAVARATRLYNFSHVPTPLACLSYIVTCGPFEVRSA